MAMPSEPQEPPEPPVVTADEHQSDPDGLLDHKYRPKTKKASAHRDYAQAEPAGNEPDKAGANFAVEGEGEELERNGEKRRPVPRPMRKTRQHRSVGDILKGNHTLEPQASERIDFPVNQDQAGLARPVSTGKLRSISRRAPRPSSGSTERPSSVQQKPGPQTFARPDVFGLVASPQKRNANKLEHASESQRSRKQRKTHAELEQEQIDDQLRMESEKAPEPKALQWSRKRPRGPESEAAVHVPSRKSARIAVAYDQGTSSEYDESEPPSTQRRDSPQKDGTDTQLQTAQREDGGSDAELYSGDESNLGAEDLSDPGHQWNSDGRSDAKRQTDEVGRVHGQLPALRGIFERRKDQAAEVKNAGIAMEDEPVQEILDKCQRVIERLSAAKGSGYTGVDPARDLAGIAEDVRALYTAANGRQPDFTNAERGKGIYTHLFLKLVEVLERMVNYYETSDTGNDDRGQLKYGPLKTINFMIDITLGLYGDQKGGAKQYRPRPSSGIKLIQPVESMCVSLKDIRKVFADVLRRHLREHGSKELKLRYTQANAAVREREQAEQLATEIYLEKRDKWAQLHSVRNRVEDRYLPDAGHYIRHIAFPEDEVEEDSDGFPIDRLEIFTPRVGPPLAMVEEARNRMWSEEEFEALLDGLRTYCGPRVFERIIKRYCGVVDKKRQILNKYNVTELVTKAADLKRDYLQLQGQVDGEVEDWVKMIPEWVKPAPLSGQENNDRNAEPVATTSNYGDWVDIYLDHEAEGL
nr:hypothetical protein CFP56_32252 [Quercus suber]